MTKPVESLSSHSRIRTGRVLISALMLFLPTVACGSEQPSLAVISTGGNPEHGPVLIRRYGCGSCHTIPGVRGARGLVGPPLRGFATRGYIAGELPNTPDHLVAWIEAPQAIEPGTAMPNLGVPRNHARHIAAYLYTLDD